MQRKGKMKIGIDIRAAQLGHGTRGIGKYIIDLVESVTRLAPEHDYVLIMLPDKPLPERLLELPSCRIVALPIQTLMPYPWSHRVRYLWRLHYIKMQRIQGQALAGLAARERLDVLHQPLSVGREFFPSCRPPCRLVQTFYDAIPAIFPEAYLHRASQAEQFVYRRQLAACRNVDVLVAISESARQDAIKYAGIASDKVRVVYPSIPEEFEPVTDGERLSECFVRLGIRPPYFLFCSGPDPTKNVTGLMEAFGEFSDEWPERYSLVMVTKETEEIKRLAYEGGVSRKRLLCTGFVSDADLVTLYAGATALVSPSLYEGFGLPTGQAMRVGTPVIASNRSSQPEVVGDAGLLVDPEDSMAIAEAMRRLAGDPALRADLSARGQERVRRFDWQHQAQGMLEIYTNGAKKHKRR
jgi:glycosyltransferase involved in cell wall biosynthesis